MSQSTELITQLRHELQVRTDLLRAYSESFAEDEEADQDSEASSGGADKNKGSSSRGGSAKLRAANVDVMQRKIQDLEKENKKLQDEATEVRKWTPPILSLRKFRHRGESESAMEKRKISMHHHPSPPPFPKIDLKASDCDLRNAKAASTSPFRLHCIAATTTPF